MGVLAPWLMDIVDGSGGELIPGIWLAFYSLSRGPLPISVAPLAFIFPTLFRPSAGIFYAFSYPPFLFSFLCARTIAAISRGMPPYCLQDCHYFYRTALRGLNISTRVSPLHA